MPLLFRCLLPWFVLELLTNVLRWKKLSAKRISISHSYNPNTNVAFIAGTSDAAVSGGERDEHQSGVLGGL